MFVRSRCRTGVSDVPSSIILFFQKFFSFPPFCVFVCCVWECVCRHVHTEARARLGMLSSVVAHIEIASYWSGSSPFCLAGGLLGSTFLHSMMPKLQAYTPMPNFSYGYWGFVLKSSHLQNKCSYSGSWSPTFWCTVKQNKHTRTHPHTPRRECIMRYYTQLTFQGIFPWLLWAQHSPFVSPTTGNPHSGGCEKRRET